MAAVPSTPISDGSTPLSDGSTPPPQWRQYPSVQTLSAGGPLTRGALISPPPRFAGVHHAARGTAGGPVVLFALQLYDRGWRRGVFSAGWDWLLLAGTPTPLGLLGLEVVVKVGL